MTQTAKLTAKGGRLRAILGDPVKCCGAALVGLHGAGCSLEAKPTTAVLGVDLAVDRRKRTSEQGDYWPLGLQKKLDKRGGLA